MTIDGFEEGSTRAFQGLSPAVAGRFFATVDRAGRRLGVTVNGIERLPEGRALLVANHAFGYDILFPMAAIFRATGRIVWSLGEHAWWKLPFVRRFAASVGVVDGTRENADTLLANDQLVLVMPGGLRESLKPRGLRYRLLWGHRYGFVRAAIRNRAPLVPLAGVGADEIFDWVGNPYERGRRWLGRFGIPIPRPSWGLPIAHRVELRYFLGEPITVQASPDQADDPGVLRPARREVEGALQEMIDAELARRAGFPMEGPDGSNNG